MIAKLVFVIAACAAPREGAAHHFSGRAVLGRVGLIEAESTQLVRASTLKPTFFDGDDAGFDQMARAPDSLRAIVAEQMTRDGVDAREHGVARLVTHGAQTLAAKATVAALVRIEARSWPWGCAAGAWPGCAARRWRRDAASLDRCDYFTGCAAAVNSLRAMAEGGAAMATIRKRSWRTASGEARESWQVDFVDQAGKRRHKQFSRKKDADAWLVEARGQVERGTFSAEFRLADGSQGGRAMD